jgi:hypothetical protein
MRPLRLVTASALVFGLSALVGCGGSSGLAPVRGQVQNPDGSPAAKLDGFSVVFEGKTPDGKAYSAAGTIDAEGRFELTTAKPGDGAPVGTCKVLIEPKMIDSERESPYPIHAKYRTFDTSGLTVEVKPGPNDVKLTVEPPAPKAKKGN